MRRRPSAADEAAARATMVQGIGVDARRLVVDGVPTARDRCGWPLHVIDDAAHASHIEQPDAFVRGC